MKHWFSCYRDKKTGLFYKICIIFIIFSLNNGNIIKFGTVIAKSFTRIVFS